MPKIEIDTMPSTSTPTGQPDEIHAQREDAEDGAAGGASHAGPEQHVRDVGGRIAHPGDDGRHPLEDVIEGRDVREVGEDQQQGEQQVLLPEHVGQRGLRRCRAQHGQRFDGGMAHARKVR
jgi:hypothetical protein